MDSSLDMIIFCCAGYDRTDFKLSPARGLLLARITKAETSSVSIYPPPKLTSESTTKKSVLIQKRTQNRFDFSNEQIPVLRKRFPVMHAKIPCSFA
jgi:hypothetical protein